MKIALFDIDGTLLWTQGAGKRAMERALMAVIGNTGPEGHRYDGKTDRQIVREALLGTGHDASRVDVHMDEIIARYLVELEPELEPADPAVCGAAIHWAVGSGRAGAQHASRVHRAPLHALPAPIATFRWAPQLNCPVGKPG